MKISLNLATLPSRRERYGMAWAVPVALIAAVGLAVLSYLAVVNVLEYRSVHKDIRRLEYQDKELSRQESALREALNQPSFREVSRQAQFVNSLIEARKLSAADLTMKVSKLMPAEVRLSAFSLTAKGEPTVRFSVVARDEQAVETFVTALEDSPDFRDVSIVNQGFETSGPEEGPVTVICTARYVGGVLP